LDALNLGPRKKPFVILDDSLPRILRNLPLTAGPAANTFSLTRLKPTGGEVETQGEGESESESSNREAPAQPISFQEAIDRTPREFYEAMKQDLDECATALEKLERTNRPRRGGRPRRLSVDPPRLSSIRKALQECRDEVELILDEKRAQDGIGNGTDLGP